VNNKKLTRAIAAATMTVALSSVAYPAFAAIDFVTATWPNIGGVNYALDSDSSGNTYGGFDDLTTPTQVNASLDFTGVVLSGGVLADINDYYGYCYGATATQATESNGDIVITCPAYEWGSTGVWFSQEFRLYSDHQVARQIFTLENRATSSADLGPGENGFYFGFNVSAKQASSQDSSSCANLTADDNWIMSADAEDSTIAGIAWQAKGATGLNASGVDCANNFQVVPVAKSSLAAGEKVNFMMFTATSQPAGTSAGEMDTAFTAAMTEMASFDALNDTLCRGISGLAVDGWGTCAATLPDTGVDTSVISTSTVIAAGLVAVGVLAVVVVRRRARLASHPES
jgi:hypothetical protein